MSYTVLARKWRPKKFAELVGQAHVMQALSNALDQQRLHHAYLFTGTRGVGKTTIARIFSKALNCEEGISSTPCGVCDTCRSIDEGRFIDLIEVDAASRTKVDDTREILDNVQFAPTQGRYKVYLIDEVHMLSKSSFNALLKTLEEPPEHVKFLLATTDPHKLPITVLSRCLQFNLMRLTQNQIQTHLEFIMAQEGLPFESTALALIAKGADGSARDALSLLDQAIAYGAGEVLFEPVQTMLGLVDQQYGLSILQALAADDPTLVKQVIQQLATMGVDYQALLSQLIETLHVLSYYQVFGDNSSSTGLPDDILKNLAQQISPERVQLLYQIALLAKQDMQLAPDVRIGFEMALIRMLAFQPAAGNAVQEHTSVTSSSGHAGHQVSEPAQAVSENLGSEGAMAVLASARSLVNKKPVANVTEASLTKTPQTTEVNEVVQTPPTQAMANDGYDLNPALGDNRILENPSPPWETSDAELQDNAPPQNFSDSGVPSTAATPSVAPVSSSDHLAQIKARLKQPLGKPEASVAQPCDTQSLESTFVEQNTPVAETEHRPEPIPSVELAQPERDEVGVFEAVFNGENSQPELAQAPVLPEPAVSFEAYETDRHSDHESIDRWLQIIDSLSLKGMAGEIARNSVLVSLSSTQMAISIDPEQDFSKQEAALLQFEEAVKQCFGGDMTLVFVTSEQHFTPVKYEKKLIAERQLQAEVAIQQDTMVQALSQNLGLEVITDSIKPV